MEMEAGEGKAWQDSTSLMSPRLRAQTPLNSFPFSEFCVGWCRMAGVVAATASKRRKSKVRVNKRRVSLRNEHASLRLIAWELGEKF